MWPYNSSITTIGSCAISLPFKRWVATPPPSPSISKIETRNYSAVNVWGRLFQNMCSTEVRNAVRQCLLGAPRSYCETHMVQSTILSTHGVSPFVPRATATDGPCQSVKVGRFRSSAISLFEQNSTAVRIAGKQFPNKRPRFQTLVIIIQ